MRERNTHTHTERERERKNKLVKEQVKREHGVESEREEEVGERGRKQDKRSFRIAGEESEYLMCASCEESASYFRIFVPQFSILLTRRKKKFISPFHFCPREKLFRVASHPPNWT